MRGDLFAGIFPRLIPLIASLAPVMRAGVRILPPLCKLLGFSQVLVLWGLQNIKGEQVGGMF